MRFEFSFNFAVVVVAKLDSVGSRQPSSPRVEKQENEKLGEQRGYLCVWCILPSHPHLVPAQPKFDQSTYMGRVRHFIAAVSPLTLFASADRLQDAHKDVLAVQERVQKSPGGVFVKPEDAQKYWKNKQLVDSSIHPGERRCWLLVAGCCFLATGCTFPLLICLIRHRRAYSTSI